jgi:acetoin utilization deacetylase AcuC-like enzyme
MSLVPVVSYSYDPVHKLHDVPGHPEHPGRVESTHDYLESHGALEALLKNDPRAATDSDLELVHPPAHIERIRRLEASGGGAIDPDTAVLPGTFSASVHATGGVLAGLDSVLREGASSAYCLVRPPGHHATSHQSMGFCFFNSVAVGARYARLRHGVERLAIVDFDVHHGNGTQEIFWNDPSVLYISTHQFPFYPGTGHWRETGGPVAERRTVNVPLPAGSGDAEYLRTFDRLLLPLIERYQPQLLLVSAGYDAHQGDPLAGMELSTDAYRTIMLRLRAVADLLCSGRLVAALEGGYNLDDLAESVAVSITALQEPSVAYAPAEPASNSFERYLDQLSDLHGLV